MKSYSKKFYISCFFLVFVFAFSSCGNDQKGSEHIPVKEHGATPAYTSTYVCPMHCVGSGGNNEGICASCGMNYVKLSEHLKNGHTH
ncbi:MAG: hypothetical protein AB8F74_22135 [Saprospiraceae bacterium]